MNEVTVSIEELLKILKENRDKHVKIYLDAVEGVRVEYAKLLKRELKRINDGEKITGNVSIPLPLNHEEEYNDVIRMLELSVDEEVELTRHEFQQYVQDKWISDHEKTILRTYAMSSSNAGLYK